MEVKTDRFGGGFQPFTIANARRGVYELIPGIDDEVMPMKAASIAINNLENSSNEGERRAMLDHNNVHENDTVAAQCLLHTRSKCWFARNLTTSLLDSKRKTKV